jgi:hypothetical protein
MLAEKLSERLGQFRDGREFIDYGRGDVARSQSRSLTATLVGMLTGAFSARTAVAKSLPYDPIRDR